MPVMEYGDEWKEHRRVFSKYFRSAAVPSYHPRIRKERTKLLQSFLNSPDEFYVHIRL